LSPEREVIVAQHTFSLYGILAQSFGARVKRVPMKDYCFDLNATVKAINDNTSIVFLTSPNNPTGSIIAANDLEAFLDDLPDQPPVIVMDQAYAEFVTEETCAMGENYLFQEKPMLVLRTFSKAYGLAGLRIGYGLSQPWLISLLNKIRPPFSVNALAHCAAMAAVSDDLHLKRTRENNSQGMKQLTADLESMGLKVIPSQANFISFLVGPHASRVYSDLLKEGVIVRHLGSFGMEEYLRVTIGLPEHNERMINALRKALAQRS
jgi:histidinol-phosphate aminotransferase